jgi:hypothetical protein
MSIFGLPGELVSLALGWLLGLLSLPIGDAIRRRYERRQLIAALKAELVELRYTMALVADNMRSTTGTRDDAFLGWLESTVVAYTGADPEQPKFLAALRLLKKQLAGATPPKRTAATSGLNLKTYDLPFLDSQVHRLSICPMAFQQQVLQIKAQLDLFNSETDFLMRQFELTFNPSLDAGNRSIVQTNLQSGYARLGRSAINIADLVARLDTGRAA